ncbi:GAF domain-containing protein [Paenibacillus agricola]|uniref:GAF domain-containing protein n=1 Tax=Paenibacillus agricola TaxID=2716264 RepID=A0ABX0JLQ1_9BACL|nr:GAF domain-containing protein [Paenibacillus agricola]NHN34965.1 GAF domain-containing protein [Paenibacillus agricola]
MKDIINSLKHFKLTKEIRTILTQLHPVNARQSDLSNVFEKLYHADLIGMQELLSIETRMSLSHYCMAMEEKLNGLLCVVYLYEEDEKRLWIGAGPSIPDGYKEYSHGLNVNMDIPGGAKDPIYIKNTLIVSNVERAQDIVTLNHKKKMMVDGFKSYCCSPLEYQGKLIGHTVLFSEQLRDFSDYEINMFQDHRNQIEKKLSQIKDDMIFILKKQQTS